MNCEARKQIVGQIFTDKSSEDRKKKKKEMVFRYCHGQKLAVAKKNNGKSPTRKPCKSPQYSDQEW